MTSNSALAAEQKWMVNRMNDKKCRDCIHYHVLESPADNYSESYCDAYDHKEIWKLDKCEKYQSIYTYITPYDYFSV